MFSCVCVCVCVCAEGLCMGQRTEEGEEEEVGGALNNSSCSNEGVTINTEQYTVVSLHLLAQVRIQDKGENTMISINKRQTLS